MNTTVEELKAYYAANGGESADVADITTIPDMIAAITAISGGGGEPAMEWVKIGRVTHSASSQSHLTPIDDAKLMLLIDSLNFSNGKTLYELVNGRTIVDVSITSIDNTSNILYHAVTACSLTGSGNGVELKRIGDRSRDCHAIQIGALYKVLGSKSSILEYDVYVLVVGEPHE